ncbi:hypothetical protein CON72_01295 [Bacillus wiedmannii]|nr:hypothetical protein CON72_01295 [Bacillus wiedmannii]
MIYSELLTWRTYQENIIFEINYNNEIKEFCCHKDNILNFEQINGGRYILLDTLTKKIFII